MKQRASMLILIGVLGSFSASAAIVYNNEAQWEAAAAGVTTINFGVLNPPGSGFLTFNTPPGLTISGVNFSGAGSQSVYVMNDGFCCSTYDRGADTLNTGVDGTITATLPANTTSIGFDLFTVTNGDTAGTLTGTAEIIVNGTTYFVNTPTAPNLAFWGITSSSPISTLQITAEQAPSGTAADIIDFAYGGTANVTPEPAYYWAVFGICALIFMRRRFLRSHPRSLRE